MRLDLTTLQAKKAELEALQQLLIDTDQDVKDISEWTPDTTHYTNTYLEVVNQIVTINAILYNVKQLDFSHLVGVM